MKIKEISYILIVLTFSACKVGHRYEAREVSMPQSYHFGNVDTINAANLKWWEVYKDTLLVKYINEALVNNQELNIAIERVEEYKSLKRISESDLLPSINISAEKDYELNDNILSEKNNQLIGELSWELDLWGRLRWQREAGIADYMASQEEKNAVHQSLIAKVATTYFELMAAKRELEIVKQTANSRKEGVRIAKLRYNGGLTSETPFRQSEVELSKTLTLLPEVEYAITQKNNLLYTLMGVFPDENLISTQMMEHRLPSHVPPGLPSELLTRRPDIRKTEQELIAANANVGMALTNRFPRITLTAEYGADSEALSELFTSPYAYLSGQLVGPIFNAGAYRARHRAAQSVFKQKALNYDKVVIQSFEETSNALAAVKKTKEVRLALIQLEQSSRDYLKLANLQHINGVVSYLDVLDAQRLLFDAEIRLNIAIKDEKIAYVNLYKALGGGWQVE